MVNRVYKDVEAGSPKVLARNIEQAIRELEAEFTWVDIITVSHAVYSGWQGTILWTAFITCLVEDENDKANNHKGNSQ